MANKGQVLELHHQNPNWSAAQIAEKLGCMPEYVRATLSRDRRKKSPCEVTTHERLSLWSEADLELLVEKREIEGKKWHVIAAEMSRPLGTCSDRYYRIVRAREPAPSIIPEPRKPSLHEEMGIETQVYRVPVLDDPRLGRRYDQIGCAWSHQHRYRESITLAKVLA